MQFLFYVVPVKRSLESIRVGSALLFLWAFLISVIVEGTIAFYRFKFKLTPPPTIISAAALLVTSLGMIASSIWLLKIRYFRTWLLITVLIFILQTAATAGPAVLCGIALSKKSLFVYTTKSVLSFLEILLPGLTYIFTWWNGLHLWFCVASINPIGFCGKKAVKAK